MFIIIVVNHTFDLNVPFLKPDVCQDFFTLLHSTFLKINKMCTVKSAGCSCSFCPRLSVKLKINYIQGSLLSSVKSWLCQHEGKHSKFSVKCTRDPADVPFLSVSLWNKAFFPARRGSWLSGFDTDLRGRWVLHELSSLKEGKINCFRDENPHTKLRGVPPLYWLAKLGPCTPKNWILHIA